MLVVFLSYLYDIIVRATLVWFVVFGVFEQDFVHVRRGVLEQFVGRIEDDERYFTVAQDTQFVGLLHQAELSFGERHLTVAFVRDFRDLNLFPSHAKTKREGRRCDSHRENN